MPTCSVSRSLLSLPGLFLLPAALSTSLPGAEVTLESLFGEMTDYAAPARWPSPEFTCLQTSSHDRRTVAPDKDGWFANDDHTSYIRTEENGGRKEHVMMDETGPGSIVRFWLTTVQNKHGILRIYLDGKAEPAIEYPSYDLLSGKTNAHGALAIPHPGYTAEGNGGNTLMLPIPYAKGCKVTWEEKGAGPRYYQINFRRYAPDTKVETFSMGKLNQARQATRAAGDALASPPVPTGTATKLERTLAPGAEAAIELPAGSASIRQLQLRLDSAPADLPAALRSTIVRIEFDGQQTVWCPAGDFFGSGAGLNELQSWYRTVEKDGTLTCRWVMPYEKSAKVTLVNTGKAAINAKLVCTTGPWTWDSRSMHFHTAWHHEENLKTRPARDWNFVNLKGRGVYVGDTLSLFNEVATWYGEGDEKIRVDGEAVPSHLGTGTEDYYGYSFAPRGIMQTPFANQTRVDEAKTQGHNVLTRTRNLDGIPYRKSLDFDIELISWAPTRMIYSATTHWYAFPGGTSNREPDIAGANSRIPHLEDAQRPPAAFPEVKDAELLEVKSATPGLVIEPQDMRPYSIGDWSRGAQLLGRATAEGQEITLTLPAPDASPRKIRFAGTSAPDFGILTFTVNGQPATSFDGYARDVSHAGEIDLGTFTPVNGKFIVRAEVTGTHKDSTASRYFFGLDYFRLSEP